MDNDELSRVLSLYRFVIPFGCTPRSDYATVEQLCEALRAPGPESGHMYLFSLSEGVVHDRYKRRIVGYSERSLELFEKRTEQCFFAVSITSLWQLMHFTKRPSGPKHDGTGGISQDLAPTIITGGLSQKYRDDQSKVTFSLRPFSFMKGSEAIPPYLLHLYCLRELCFQLFGTSFTIECGTSDHSAAFVTAHRHFHHWPEVCDLTWRSLKVPISQHQSQTISSSLTLAQSNNRGCTGNLSSTQNDTLFGKCSQGTQNDLSQSILPETVISVSNDQENANFKTTSKSSKAAVKLLPLITNHFPSFVEPNRRKQTSLSDVLRHPSLLYQPVEGVTLCYFHVVQHFRQNSSFVRAFKDRMFAAKDDPFSTKEATRKKLKSNNKEVKEQASTSMFPRAYHMVQWIHRCRTEQQKTAISYLILLNWIVCGESSAADLFYRSYCSSPYNCWNYATTAQATVPWKATCIIESRKEHAMPSEPMCQQKDT
ncbi:unknown protein [Seminavis robusta]|uniref:Uncharacterized protein n=1 Tax=Seminavis robusta TaxID=568900 RepID=A0A9N8F482_9STRA|nr:unknown protein [Seminavis robusta]|eukprot:Sro3456_g348200.1 n/a (483) ;mRNA; r:744-2192